MGASGRQKESRRRMIVWLRATRLASLFFYRQEIGAEKKKHSPDVDQSDDSKAILG
jgi:hypothetical protein